VNCKINGKESPVTPIACFNTNNGSISINKGEMLPFYRNIERVDNGKYITVKGYDNKDALEAYDDLSN
jgi:hypothetical protein